MANGDDDYTKLQTLAAPRKPERRYDPIRDFLDRSAEQMVTGAHELYDPSGTTAADPRWWDVKAKGAADVLQGSAPYLAPLGLPAAAEAPVAAGAGLLLGSAAGDATEAAARRKGIGPGQASMLGTLAGIGAGGVAGGGVEAASAFREPIEDMGQAALSRILARGSLTGERAAAMPIDDITDMAIYGASKIARGVTDFNDWSKQMAKELGAKKYSQLRPNLEKIWALSNKNFQRYSDTLKKYAVNPPGKPGQYQPLYPEQAARGEFPTLQQLQQQYGKGKYGGKWYQNTWKKMQDWFGPDAERMVDFLAATSPQQTVPGNVTLALDNYRRLKEGEPFKALGKHMLEQSVRGEPFGGLKVSSFKKNIMGDPLPVTIDLWMSRIFGFSDSPTDAQYKFMDYLITQTAKEKGIPPREYQASLWAAIRDAQAKSSASGASFEEIMRRKFAADPDLMASINKWKTMKAPARPRTP